MDPLFTTLLAPPWPERFSALSAALLESEPLAWLSRAYHATLLTGALSPDALANEAMAAPYQAQVRAFLTVSGLPGREPGELDIAAKHLAPVQNASPYGHNSPFPYKPPYTLADVRAALATELPAGPDRAEALKALLTGGDGRAAVAQSILALWYCGALLDLGSTMAYFIKTAPMQTWAAGRVWTAIGGNPMGIPGPYYGNWAYPPPSPVLEEA